MDTPTGRFLDSWRSNMRCRLLIMLAALAAALVLPACDNPGPVDAAGDAAASETDAGPIEETLEEADAAASEERAWRHWSGAFAPTASPATWTP